MNVILGAIRLGITCDLFEVLPSIEIDFKNLSMVMTRQVI